MPWREIGSNARSGSIFGGIALTCRWKAIFLSSRAGAPPHLKAMALALSSRNFSQLSGNADCLISRDEPHGFLFADSRISKPYLAMVAAGVPILPELLVIHARSHSKIRNHQRSRLRNQSPRSLPCMASGRLWSTKVVLISWTNERSSASVSPFSCW